MGSSLCHTFFYKQKNSPTYSLKLTNLLSYLLTDFHFQYQMFSISTHRLFTWSTTTTSLYPLRPSTLVDQFVVG